jgi:hypothetical protein
MQTYRHSKVRLSHRPTFVFQNKDSRLNRPNPKRESLLVSIEIFMKNLGEERAL